jgi:nucleoside-diphosphate-sugar epimerase
MKTVLVTGGGGFLGNAIVKLLVEKNIEVRTLSRKTYPNLTALGVEQVQGDIADAAVVTSACKGIDTIFHTAAKAGIWGPYHQFYQTNVIGTQNIITACKVNSGVNLIYTSSPSVVFDGKDIKGADESAPYPRNYNAYYPKTKAMAEQSVLKACENGLCSIILRPHLIWGPEDNHLVPAILARAHRLRQIGDGSNRVDTVYIDNAALAHLLAQKALSNNPSLSGRIYFISQDKPIRLWEMVNHILAAEEKPPITRTISPPKAYMIGVIMETLFRLLRIKQEPPMTRFLAQELSLSHWFNISAAKRDLKYEPKVSIEEGLKRLRKWLINGN